MSKDAHPKRVGADAAPERADLRSASESSGAMWGGQREFVALMMRISQGWTNRDTSLALSAFAEDALYTEPPDFQIYRGAGELRVFFDRITPGATMIWRHLWYNAETGYGAGEYSFKNGGRTTAVHGVAVVEILNGKIKIWREYQRRGAVGFDDFHNPDDKQWQTTVDDLQPRLRSASGLETPAVDTERGSTE